MTDLIEVNTADLAGEALGLAVGTAQGLDLFIAPPEYGNPWRVFARYQGQAIAHTKRYNPWEDWALGGPLFDKHCKGFGMLQDGKASRYRAFAYNRHAA
ncbi:phage protein NinX family protein [Pseudomonas sp. SAS7]